MISISVFELIPDSTLVLYNNFGIFWTFIIGSVMFLLGKTLVTKINKKNQPYYLVMICIG